MDINQLIESGLVSSATTNNRVIPKLQSLSGVFNNQFNSVVEKVRNIKNDTSRVRSEKAPLYAKVSKKIDSELAETLGIAFEVIQSEKALYQDTIDSTLKSGDKLVNLVLAMDLRDKKDSAKSLMESDIRYVQASNEFPADYFKLNNSEMKELQMSSLHKLMPELETKRQEIERSENHARHLTKYYDKLNGAVNGFTDAQALENRVDPDTL
ncbi:hypothetical protein [Brumicola blandensis]|uniref:Uncharacterized protein n=1 Tax=Brumicola blandensis TaxID=3075611 RepID=A0AAW8QXU4_9ALTE|nr:hypothetical protein [Alteromonas sp. W409]MDT0581435.1 hypothetical protein [Alteromonas sp. W409]